MPLPALVLLFIAVPLAELYVIIQVGQAIGAPWTIAILAIDSVLGSLLLRAQGRATWRRFSAAVSGGRIPHREIIDGALVILGGALLLTPGFITDVFGLGLLLPPTRAIARRAAIRMLGGRIAVGVAGAATGARRERARAGSEADVEGTAIEWPADGEAEGSAPRLPR